MNATLIFTAFLAVLATLPAAAAEVDLAAMQLGQSPAGFEFLRTGRGAPGRWVVTEEVGAAKGRAIVQTDKDTTDYRFPLAVLPEVSAKNVEVTLRFKPIAGRGDQAGGIAVRLASADDYYVVRANALEDNVRFYRVVRGDRQQIGGANTKVARGTWHSLSIKAEGDRFTIGFDGKPLFSAQDKTFAEAGRVALWTKADSVTAFDSITVNPLP